MVAVFGSCYGVGMGGYGGGGKAPYGMVMILFTYPTSMFFRNFNPYKEPDGGAWLFRGGKFNPKNYAHKFRKSSGIANITSFLGSLKFHICWRHPLWDSVRSRGIAHI